jgi:phage/plasmid-associated DNA primase
METLDWAPDQFEYVYSTDIAIQPVGSKGYNDAKQFFLQLADGNKELAKDYPQAVAPMFMSNRPGGIIWFIGDGANGKSAYIKAINLGFSRYTVSLSTSAMEDGRDAPSVIGKLANIVNEASESRIEDTHVYKAIGTHESFTVHEFHKQGGLEIKADFHTVFNANNIPLFSDKTKGARRRTLPVPFPAHFQDNPTFERDTFTPEFLGGMFALILESAQAIRDNGNQYAWSAATLALKDSYDSEVNSVEAYLTHLKDIGVCGFINYTRLKMEYEIWCSNSGLVPLMMSNLRRTMSTDGGACRRSYRDSNNNVRNAYYFSTAPEGDNLVWLDNGYGMPKAKQRILPSTAKLSEEW